MRRLSALALALSLSLTSLVAASSVAAQTGCDPFQTPPEYDATVPTAEDVLGFDFGEVQMSVADINAYLGAVDGARGRVSVAEAATSVLGTSIMYAVVGSPEHLADLAGIKERLAALQDPATTDEEAAGLAANTPAILWVAANVHGGEESGADASLHALYELAARDDCVVDEILANAIVVVLPTQNPDGREIGQRRNLNGFDMNRDWFARTQPETDGKLDVVREYPPTLFIDAHEFGLGDYFFPPNADPEYHEIPDQAHDWINGLYSPAIVSQFDNEGIKFFHGAPYDFFAIVFGDTVPANGLRRGRDDIREGGRRPDLRARARALHGDVGVTGGRSGAGTADAPRLAPVLGRSVRRGRCWDARGERGLRTAPRPAPGRPGRPCSRLLHRERPGPGLRNRPAHSATPADGRRSPTADGAAGPG